MTTYYISQESTDGVYKITTKDVGKLLLSLNRLKQVMNAILRAAD